MQEKCPQRLGRGLNQEPRSKQMVLGLLMPAPHALVPPNTHGLDGCSLAVMRPQCPGAGDGSCCPLASHQPPLALGAFLIQDPFLPSCERWAVGVGVGALLAGLAEDDLAPAPAKPAAASRCNRSCLLPSLLQSPGPGQTPTQKGEKRN